MEKGNGYNFKLQIEEVKRLYFIDKQSCGEIAKRFGVTKAAVRLLLSRNGIKLRTKSNSQELNSNFITLDKKIKEFLNGLLLGDGSLVMARHQKSARYSHSDKNKEYINWLKKELENFGFKVETSTEIRGSRKYYHLNTKSYRDLIEVRKIWYPLGEKKTPDIRISPIVLFNWYIGDGHYNPPVKIGGLTGEGITIAMLYDKIGRKNLVEKLNKLGICCTEHQTCIYIKAKSRKDFFRYMGRHKLTVPVCYKYKFPERYYAA